MTPEQLAEIRARSEAATPGPWECIESFPPGEYTLAARLPDEAFPLTLAIVGNDDAWEDAEANTQFAAHARTDIPALLDYIEGLETEARADVSRSRRSPEQGRDQRVTIKDATTIDWAVDSDGVYVCSMCWDEEIRALWLKVEACDGMYCESCHRFVGGEPEWMCIRRLTSALSAIMDATTGSENEQAGRAWMLANAALERDALGELIIG